VGSNDTKGRKRATMAFQWLGHLRHVEHLERVESKNFLELFHDSTTRDHENKRRPRAKEKALVSV
jgi:hypothetical protein